MYQGEASGTIIGLQVLSHTHSIEDLFSSASALSKHTVVTAIHKIEDALSIFIVFKSTKDDLGNNFLAALQNLFFHRKLS